jgi:hypothetical protein
MNPEKIEKKKRAIAVLKREIAVEKAKVYIEDQLNIGLNGYSKKDRKAILDRVATAFQIADIGKQPFICVLPETMFNSPINRL